MRSKNAFEILYSKGLYNQRMFFSRSPSSISSVRCLLLLALLFYCFDFFFRISPSLVVPHLMAKYQLTAFGIAGFSSAFYLGYALFQIPTGLLLDTVRVNHLLSLSLLLCGFSCFLFIGTHHYVIALIARFLLGIGSAVSFVSVLFLEATTNRLSVVAGIAISIGTLFASLIQVLGAWLIQIMPWQMMFIGFGMLSIFMAVIVLFSALQVVKPNQFCVTTWKQALFDLLKNRSVIYNGLIGGLFYLPTTLFCGLWGVSFLEDVYHFTSVHASLGVTVVFLGWVIGSPLFGWIASRVENCQWLLSCSAFMGSLVSYLMLRCDGMQAFVFFPLFLLGFLSSVQCVIWRVLEMHCPKLVFGFGIALTHMIIIACGLLFHLLLGYLLSKGPTMNYQQMLLIIPVVFFVAGGCLLCKQR